MILVTGGTGLVGAHLLLELTKKNQGIRATYRNQKKLDSVKKVFSYYSENPNKLFDQIDWVKADVNDLSSLEGAFKNINQVYHAAALVSFDPKDDKNLLKTNVEGTANVVNLCVAHKVTKLCFVSSIAALGPSINGKAITEENPWGDFSNTAYAISKHYAEMEVWRASQEGVPVVIVNPGIIIGAGYWRTSSGSFFAHANSAPNYHLPNGTGFVAIEDVIRAMVQLMESTVTNERFILVNENWSYQTFSHLLAKGLNKPLPKNEVTPWKLDIFWRLDWLRSKILAKRRRLSKATANTLKTCDIYDNSKLPEHIDFSYCELEKVVADCCTIFLREFG